MDAETLQFHAVLSQAATRVEAALDGLLPAGDTTLGAAMRHAVLVRRQAAARLPGARERGDLPGAAGPAAAHRRGGRVHARLQPGARRPALHGRRRPAPRPADGAREVGRGDGGARRATRCRRWPSRSSPRRRAASTPRVQARLILHLAQAAGALGMVGGQALDIAAETAAAPLDLAADHRPAGAEDRLALRLGGGVGRDPRPLRPGAAAPLRRRRSGSPSRSATTSSMSTATPRPRASGCARTRRRARRPSSRCWASTARARKARELVADACDSLAPYGSAAGNLRRAAQFVLERGR